MTSLPLARRSLSLALLLLCSVFAYGQPLKRYVTDLTSSLGDNERSMLESQLAGFEEATSTQIVVVIVATIGSGSLEETALRIAEENGIGQKGKNNGALLFIAKDDRKLRIEVGFGLEGVLTDALCGQIIRREIVPRLKQGQFFEGIQAGVNAMMAATKNEYTAETPGQQSKGPGILPVILIVLIFLFISSRSSKGKFLGGGVPPIIFPGGGRRGSSGWGRGFSGGGGSFGGGGSSGSW